MDCRVLLCQTNPRLGDVHANLADHLRLVDEARARGVQLALFPDLSLTGYFLRDQVYELGLALDSPTLGPLLERSTRISIALGFVERTRDGRLYNSYALLEDGAVKGVHRKVHLVSYGLFDEARDFAAGEAFEPFESKHGRFGTLICEDAWHVPGSYLHFLNDVDALLIPSASPARGVEASGDGLGSQRTWDALLTSFAILYRSWVVYAARVGWEDGIGFGGATAIIDPFGNRVARLEGLEPGTLEGLLERRTLHRARTETPLRRDEKPWILASQLGRHVPLLALAREERRSDEDARRG